MLTYAGETEATAVQFNGKLASKQPGNTHPSTVAIPAEHAMSRSQHRIRAYQRPATHGRNYSI